MPPSAARAALSCLKMCRTHVLCVVTCADAKVVKRAESRAACPSSILASECAALVSRLGSVDEQRGAAERARVAAERAEVEAAEARRKAEDQRVAQAAAAAAATAAAAAAEKEEKLAAAAAAATEAMEAGRRRAESERDAETSHQSLRLQSAILALLSTRGPTHATAIWHYLHSTLAVGDLDGESVERALEGLKASFAIYEARPGFFCKI